MDDAPLQLTVFTDQETDQGRRLGCETMPETVTYSTVAAVHRNWRGLGFDIGDRLAERNPGRSRGLALCRLSLRWLSA